MRDNNGSAAGALPALLEQGLALHRAGQLADARSLYGRILRRDPRHFDALHLTAMTFAQEGRFELALPFVVRALSRSPNVGAARALQGAVLHGLKRSDEALAAFDRALLVEAANAEIHSNRGSVLNDLGRHAEALASFDAALALAPDFTGAHYNRGVALSGLARPAEAMQSYDAALRLQPDHPDAILNRGFARLQLGDLLGGWPDFEARLGKWYIAHHLHPPQTRWRGEQPIAGRRVFVHYEQGLGDTLQFARYLPLLRQAGADVCVSVQDPLTALLRRALPGISVLGEREAPAQFDWHCPLMGLPLALGTSLETIPPMGPPLRPDPILLDRMSSLTGERSRRRIGVSWSGSTAHPNDHNRSIAFEAFRGLVDAVDADWISLQNEIRAGDREAFGACGRVRFLGEHQSSFDHTAALVDQVDLVITVDTSIAHLAGAMGKPVWVLLPYNPDWRWMLGRPDTPWYPTARLFRQPAPKAWDAVLADVAFSLRDG